MKSILLIIAANILTITIGFAQLKMDKNWQESLRYYSKTNLARDADFKITQCPETFQKEAVVVLCQKYYFSFLKGKALLKLMGAKGAGVSGAFRKRIKIQDKSALSDFSEFFFQKADVLGITIIKPNGQGKVLDMTKAIKVKTEVPRYSRSGFQNSAYYKIVLPNLEVGDIIDQFSVFKEGYEKSISFLTTASGEYPIVKQAYIFDIYKDWVFFHKSLNGAPVFKITGQDGQDYKGNYSNKIERYVMEDENRDARKYERWDYPFLEEPTFKVIAFQPGQTTIRNPPDLRKVKIDKYRPPLGSIKNMYPLSLLLGETRGLGKSRNWKNLPDEKLTKELYHFIRYKMLPIENRPVEDLENTFNLDYYVSMNSIYFIVYFKHFLDKYKIPNKLVYAVPTYYGKIEEAITEYEAQMGVYINSTGQYYFPPDNYLKPGEISYFLEGAEVYKAEINSEADYNKGLKIATKAKLPSSTSKDHLHHSRMEVNLSESLTEPKATLTLSLHKRYRHAFSSLYLYNENYRATDEQLFSTGNYVNRTNSSKKRNNLESEKEAKKEAVKLKLATINRYFEGDYPFKEILDCEVLSTGRFKDEPLKVKLSIILKDVVKKAGKNQIFSIGKLIGEQVELDKEEIAERSNDIHFGTGKLITNDLKIILPNNYEVAGLDNLTFDIDNEYMAFKSSATLANNVLKIMTRKEYKKATVPKSEWAKVVAGLEAAYKFTQAKLVLKKQRDEKTEIKEKQG